MKTHVIILMMAMALLFVVNKTEAQSTITLADFQTELQEIQKQLAQKATLTPSMSKVLQMNAVEGYVITRIEKSAVPDDFFKDNHLADTAPELETRTNISYDESGMIEIMYYDYDTGGQTWLLDRRVLFDRDEDGYVRTSEYYDRFDEVFVPMHRMSWNFYQQTQMPESILRERWEDGEWHNSELETVTYTEGVPVSVLFEHWLDGDWSPHGRFRFIEEGNDVVQLYELWEEQWVNAEKTTFTDGSLTDIIDFMIFMEEQNLMRLEEDLFSFFDQFPFTSMTEEVWNTDDQKWEYMEHFIKEQDVDEEEADRAVLIKHWEEGDWQMQFRLLFSDNAAGSIDDIWMQFPVDITEDGIVWHTQMIEDYTYDAEELLANVTRRAHAEDTFVDMVSLDFTWDEDPAPTDAESPDRPTAAALHAAYPNPFNPVTVVPYEIGTDGHVAIRLHDITGRYVTTLFEGRQPAGQHQVVVRADALASGVYIVRMEMLDYTGIRKITVVK